MSLYKRGKTWHTDFSVNGERFRQSLDTTDWREAQAKEKELIGQAVRENSSPRLTCLLGWASPRPRIVILRTDYQTSLIAVLRRKEIA